MNKWILGFAVLGLLTSCGGEDTEEKEGKKESKVIETKVTSANAGDLTIGYYDTEKLYTDFKFFSTKGAELEAKAQGLEAELLKWQQIGQSNLNKIQDPSLSVEQQMAADKKMQQAQAKIQQIQQGDAYNLQLEQAQFNATLEEKLLKYSEEYGKENGIKLIFARGAGSGISYIDEAFDITDSFIAYMNAKEEALNQELEVTPEEK